MKWGTQGGGENVARRPFSPYNGKQYLLNINSYELHDLDNEKNGCQINEIKREHIEMYDSLQAVRIALRFRGRRLNGCYYCLRREDIG